MKKNFLATMAVGLLAAGLTACGGGSKSLTYENYKVECDTTNEYGVPCGIRLSVDIPQGEGEQLANVEMGLREIMAQSAIGQQIGEPADGPLTDAANDFAKRFLEMLVADEEMGNVTGVLNITKTAEDEQSVTFHVEDGIFVNGGPQTYERVVSFTDGSVKDPSEVEAAEKAAAAKESAAAEKSEGAKAFEEQVRGDVAAFELRGPVKECKLVAGDYQVTLTFDENRQWIKEDGKPLSQKFPGGVKRDEKGRIVRGKLDRMEDLFISYTYDKRGLIERIEYHEYMDGGSVVEYEYNDQAYARTQIIRYMGIDGIDEETGEKVKPTYNKCKNLELDAHGNWTKRTCGDQTQTRTITYYE